MGGGDWLYEIINQENFKANLFKLNLDEIYILSSGQFSQLCEKAE